MPKELFLSDYPTRSPESLDKDDVEKEFKKIRDDISDLQYKLMAADDHNLLVIFQGMDASGKDGSSHKVFGECGPLGIRAHSFKKPTDEEFAHDFLWRVHKLAPKSGEVVIFNRSHYEDILIQRVHGWIDEEKVNARINAINAFEELLVNDNNTTILKFYMHISKERQEEKLRERIETPRKNWKHNDGDWEEREHWDKYMDCYQDAILRCSKVPWIIVPCDQRWYRNYVVGQKVLETLEAINPQLPNLETEKFK